MMKKFLAILLVLTMALCLFACGGKDTETPDNNDKENVGGEENNDGGNAEVKGETYSTGNFSALVPEGWKAFPVSDIWSDDADAKDPDALQIVKGGETDWDLFTKPYIKFDYYGPSESLMTPSSEWYDNATDLEPITAGKYTWNGFSATSMDVPMIILWAEDGDYQYQATIWTDQGDGTISVTDADVLAILASVAPAA